jgi:hypothetical protein
MFGKSLCDSPAQSFYKPAAISRRSQGGPMTYVDASLAKSLTKVDLNEE